MLLNLKFNEVVAKFGNAAGVGTADHLRLSSLAKPKAGGGACTAIAFRTGATTYRSCDACLGCGAVVPGLPNPNTQSKRGSEECCLVCHVPCTTVACCWDT